MKKKGYVVSNKKLKKHKKMSDELGDMPDTPRRVLTAEERRERSRAAVHRYRTQRQTALPAKKAQTHATSGDRRRESNRVAVKRYRERRLHALDDAVARLRHCHGQFVHIGALAAQIAAAAAGNSAVASAAAGSEQAGASNVDNLRQFVPAETAVVDDIFSDLK